MTPRERFQRAVRNLRPADPDAINVPAEVCAAAEAAGWLGEHAVPNCWWDRSIRSTDELRQRYPRHRPGGSYRIGLEGSWARKEWRRRGLEKCRDLFVDAVRRLP
jgi:hypothetical protein